MIPENLPRYPGFAAEMPVWWTTANYPGSLHRFFDTSPISPSGRYLAVLQMPFEDRRPEPGEAGRILVIDLTTGQAIATAETRGWETQLGANLNWGADDHALYYNDVDPQTWDTFAWKHDPLRDSRERLDGTVYHASPDGCWLISANLKKMRKTQSGYGVCVPFDTVRPNLGAVDDDGFYLTDTATGQSRLLVSVQDLLSQASPAVTLPDPEAFEIYAFHSKFNVQSDRLMLSLRWFPRDTEPAWNRFDAPNRAVSYAWVTMKLDGSEMHCAVGPEQWEKGGHHATWFPDGHRISMNLNLDREGLRFVQVEANGDGLQTMVPGVTGSGHPTVSPNPRFLLTDTYYHETAFLNASGTAPLRWVDLETGKERALVYLPIKTPYADSVLRVDPHPAWDAAGQVVTFNALVDGTRHVFIADMRRLVEAG